MERYNALLDIDTHVLLSIGDPATVNFLTEAIAGSFQAISVNWPNYLEDFFVLKLNPAQYPEWTWSAGDREFRKTAPDFFREEFRERSVLAAEKKRAAGYMMRYVSLSRGLLDKGTAHQDLIYLEKRSEAERLRKAGYRMDDRSDFPFLTEYADVSGIKIQEAAERVLEAAKKDLQKLAKTEALRVLHFDKLKKANTPEEVHAVLRDFSKDSFYGGLLSTI